MKYEESNSVKNVNYFFYNCINSTIIKKNKINTNTLIIIIIVILNGNNVNVSRAVWWRALGGRNYCLEGHCWKNQNGDARFSSMTPFPFVSSSLSYRLSSMRRNIKRQKQLWKDFPPHLPTCISLRLSHQSITFPLHQSTAVMMSS